MKLEMGESLIASWLKHNYSCQIVHQNWKASAKWDQCIEKSKIEKLLKEIKKKFSELDLDFTTKKMKSSQMIQQGEIDCLGICLKISDFNDESLLMVDKIYAVEVAFHEDGLNYGGIEETCKRIRKKYIRMALTIYQYFGVKEAVIIFASPKTLQSHVELIKQTAVDVTVLFKELGFNFEFKLYCNEDFENNIFKPVCNILDEVSDTSELFLRSLKLANLFNPIKIQKPNNILEGFVDNDDKVSGVTSIKIGVTAKRIFEELSNMNTLSDLEINNLCDSNYSKQILGLPFPVLMKFKGDEDDAFVNGRRRYYSETVTFNNKEYLLCNHWVEDKREMLVKWHQDLAKGIKAN